MLKGIKASGCLLLLLSSSSFASGAYLGASAGPESADFYQTSTVTQLSNFDVHNSVHYSGTGAFGSLFGGYAWIHKNVYLAGELNGNLSSVASRMSNDEYIHSSFSSTKYSIPVSYGVSFVPGYLFTPNTLFYGRLGYVSGQFKSNTSDASLSNVSKYLNGFRYGLGVRQSVASHWALLMEYSHVNYENVSMVTNDTTSSTLKITDISPSSGQVQFGLVYDFA